MKAAFYRLIAAALAVFLWPYAVDALARFVEYLDGAPSYEGPDDFWPVAGIFRFFGACSIFFAWIIRYFLCKFYKKNSILLSYIISYFGISALLFMGEVNQDYSGAISSLHGSLLALSMIVLHDLIFKTVAKLSKYIA